MNLLVHLRTHPAMTGVIGTISGWASVDLLRSAQIAAALLAAIVSLMSAIIIAPKAWAQVNAWCGKAKR